MYIYLTSERFYIRKPTTVVTHHGKWSPTWEEAWASACQRPQPRCSSGGGCHHLSLREQAVPGCCPRAGAGDSDGVLVVGYVRWVRSCWQAKELWRSWAAAHCQGGWTRDRQALYRGWTALRSLPNGIIPWFCDIRTNKRKQIFLNRSMKETLSTGNLVIAGMNRFVELW